MFLTEQAILGSFALHFSNDSPLSECRSINKVKGRTNIFNDYQRINSYFKRASFSTCQGLMGRSSNCYKRKKIERYPFPGESHSAQQLPSFRERQRKSKGRINRRAICHGAGTTQHQRKAGTCQQVQWALLQGHCSQSGVWNENRPTKGLERMPEPELKVGI